MQVATLYGFAGSVIPLHSGIWKGFLEATVTSELLAEGWMGFHR